MSNNFKNNSLKLLTATIALVANLSAAYTEGQKLPDYNTIIDIGETFKLVAKNHPYTFKKGGAEVILDQYNADIHGTLKEVNGYYTFTPYDGYNQEITFKYQYPYQLKTEGDQTIDCIAEADITINFSDLMASLKQNFILKNNMQDFTLPKGERTSGYTFTTEDGGEVSGNMCTITKKSEDEKEIVYTYTPVSDYTGRVRIKYVENDTSLEDVADGDNNSNKKWGYLKFLPLPSLEDGRTISVRSGQHYRIPLNPLSPVIAESQLKYTIYEDASKVSLSDIVSGSANLQIPSSSVGDELSLIYSADDNDEYYFGTSPQATVKFKVVSSDPVFFGTEVAAPAPFSKYLVTQTSSFTKVQDAEDSQYRTDSNYAGTAPQLKYVITCPKALELTITDKDNTSIQPSLVEGQENTYSFPIDPNNMPYDYKYTPSKAFDLFTLSYYAENGDGGKTAEKNITFTYERIVPKFNTSDDDNLIISLAKGKSYDGIFANATVEDGLAYAIDMDQGPRHGEVTITDNKYTYTPNESFIKGVTDSFSYYAQDDKDAKTTTKKTVNFIYQNTPPTAD